MRRFGWRRRSLSESSSFDDATLTCSVASINELFPLASVGPFHKAVSTAFRQGNINFVQPYIRWSYRNGIGTKNYQEIRKSEKCVSKFAHTDDLFV
jgi:hypothetical protein